MFLTVSVLFLVVVLAAGVLGYEARTGAFEPAGLRAWTFRAATFFGAATAGSVLAIASVSGEWMFALALLPVTVLCVIRFGMLARARRAGLGHAVLAAAVFALAVSAGLRAVPYALDRTFIVEGLNAIELVRSAPKSIAPGSREAVRA